MLIHISQVASTTVKQAYLNWQCLLQHAVPIPKERTQGSLFSSFWCSISVSCIAVPPTANKPWNSCPSWVLHCDCLQFIRFYYLIPQGDARIHQGMHCHSDLWSAFGQRFLHPLANTLRRANTTDAYFQTELWKQNNAVAIGGLK